jgi:hypothetical protein
MPFQAIIAISILPTIFLGLLVLVIVLRKKREKEPQLISEKPMEYRNALLHPNSELGWSKKKILLRITVAFIDAFILLEYGFLAGFIALVIFAFCFALVRYFQLKRQRHT